jgi:alpha-glucosidase (family GH31 glycosyl hydrolase)
MPLEYPDAPGVWGDVAEHQYCFGAELLVAPVYYGFSRTRLVYLPAGKWRDFWSGKLLEGGRVVRCQAEVDQIPVFARAGAIIPYLDPIPDTVLPASQEGVCSAGDDLRLDLYPGADGHFRLHDGTQFTWDEAAQTLTISASPLARQLSVRRVGLDAEYDRLKVTGPGVFTWEA